jgi:hypothetical protein
MTYEKDLEFGEFGDGWWDSADEIGDVQESEGTKEREVSDGWWERDRFREFEVLENKAADSVRLCVYATVDTLPIVAAVSGWVPRREIGWVAQLFFDLE